MNPSRFIIVAALALASVAQAQDYKIMVDKKGRVGFADQNGNEVVKCAYESAQPFRNGCAIVTKSGKSGLIDATGKVVLPLKYTQILPWTDKCWLIKNGKTMGLAASDGKVLVDAKYSLISRPNCYGKALIAKGGKATVQDNKTYMKGAKYGIVGSDGKVIIEPSYKGLYEFSWDASGKYPYFEGKRLEFSYHFVTDTLKTDCSYLGFAKNGLNIYGAGILDATGNMVMKTGLYDFVMEPKSGMVRYYIIKKKETLCGYHNLTTGKGMQVKKVDNNINDINFWTHGDFIGDIAPVNGSSWSLIDKTGKQLRTGYQSLIHNLPTNLWAGKNASGKWEVFDDSNSDVPELSGYTSISFPIHKEDAQVISVQKDGGKYGVIDRSGKTVVPFDYDLIYSNSFDFMGVRKDKKSGLLKADGSIVVPAQYAKLYYPEERGTTQFWVMKQDSLFYHYNSLTKKVGKDGYKYVTNFRDGVALAVPVGMKTDDNQVNRALLYAPNTKKETLDKIDMSKHQGGYFGFLVAEDDKVVMDRPVTTMYQEAVIKKIRERGQDKLTESDKKAILLDVTTENRSYDLKSTLDENEWNY